ncbi:hypothetical protein BX616_004055, partial [Lobosporangium transversale]
EFERIKRHHEAFAANTWDSQGLQTELRACMILNRYSRNLMVMYASPTCEQIFHIDSEQIVGKPVLLFVRADDLASFVEQLDMIKASSSILHMKFWFQSPNWAREIPCEAMIFGASDGIVAIMRRCRPFVRKHFLTNRAHYDVYNSRNSSWSSTVSTAQSYTSTPSSSVSSSPITMSKLREIRIVEQHEDGKVKPLTIPKDDPSLMSEISSFPHGVKEIQVRDYVEEEDDDDEDGDEDEYEEDDSYYDDISKDDDMAVDGRARDVRYNDGRVDSAMRTLRLREQ